MVGIGVAAAWEVDASGLEAGHPIKLSVNPIAIALRSIN